MIYFITNKPTTVASSRITTVSGSSGTVLVLREFDRVQTVEIGIDVETNGLKYYHNQIVLVSLYFPDTDNAYVIDCTSVKAVDLFPTNYQSKYYIGHNIKFDHNMLLSDFDIDIRNVYDTMIIEQRLLQNSGVEFTLTATCNRRLGYVPEGMDKSLSTKYVGKKLNNIEFDTEDIIYAATDVIVLPPLLDKQYILAEKYNMNFLLNEIENPLVNILGKCEMTGWDIDEDMWMQVATENKVQRHELSNQLDTEVRELRDTIIPKERRCILVGGKFDLVRNAVPERIVIDLFDSTVDTFNEYKKMNKKNTNYGSYIQIIDIFGRLGQQLCTHTGEYAIPIFDTKKGKVTNVSTFSTGAKDFEVFLIEKPETPMRKFIELLLKHKKLTTQLDKYGRAFIEDFKDSITGRFHTIYRQCGTANARFASGDAKIGYYNSQNIPKEPKFRHCFRAPDGYSIVTCDLSGAEVIIMADKAHDLRLLELSDGDIHSHMATAGWRNIWRSRGDYNLAENFIVSKKKNTIKRQSAKNLTFGSIYGCGAKTAAKTISVSKNEGQIYIDSIKQEIPATFAMVERASTFAIKNGYLNFNGRTNSRAWFPDVIQSYNSEVPMSWTRKEKTKKDARNYTISGTQADMVKEAIVEIQKTIDAHNVDAQLMKQVHDELVYKFHKSTTYVPFTPDEGTLITDLQLKKGTTTPIRYSQKYFVTFPEFVSLTMQQVANRYLTHVKMGAEYEVMDSWTK